MRSGMGETRERDLRSRARRGATPMRPPQPAFELAPLLAQVRALPWKWMALAVLVPVLCVLLYQAANIGLQRFDRNVGVIEITGDFHNVSRQELQQELMYLTQQSFFSVNLREAQDKIESLPWIRTSQVQRVWPNKLVFRVEEQNPIALWGTEQILGQSGDVFAPANRDQYAQLPQLRGPEGSQSQVWLNFIHWRQLLQPLGLTLAAVDLEPRGAWELKTQEGVLIKLGRDDLENKMGRLEHIFSVQLRDKLNEIEVLDARYANGMAVRWKDQTSQQPSHG